MDLRRMPGGNEVKDQPRVRAGFRRTRNSRLGTVASTKHDKLMFDA